jgi:hypothetical protein
MPEIKVNLGIDKLLEVVASGVGAIGAPWQMRRMARAELDVQKMKRQAELELGELRRLPAPPPALAAGQAIEIDVELIDLEQPIPLVNRVQHRLEYQEGKRQVNIEDIVFEAQREIERDPEVSADPVDDDWIARFFANAQDVSTAQMKRLWAKILAGEVRHPGSYSLRCLEILRNMTTSEAALVASLASYVNSGDAVFQAGPFVGRLSLLDHMSLVEAGVLNPTPVGRFLSTPPTSSDSSLTAHGPVEAVVPFADVIAIVRRESGLSFAPMIIWRLTAAGRELMELFDVAADREHLRWFCDHFRAYKCVVAVHRIVRNEPLEWDPAPIDLKQDT